MVVRSWQSCRRFMCTQNRGENILLKWRNCMKKTCEICNGSGQISYFKGVSRFLLSWEDCPECHGSGYQVAPDDVAETEDNKDDVSTQLDGSSEEICQK